MGEGGSFWGQLGLFVSFPKAQQRRVAGTAHASVPACSPLTAGSWLPSHQAFLLNQPFWQYEYEWTPSPPPPQTKHILPSFF